MQKFNIAIVGATGLVGRTFLTILSERKIPIKNLYLFASKNSAGKVVSFNQKDYVVEELCEQNLKDKKIDFALFSAGGEVSKNFAPIFASMGTTVIDNSSAFRMEKDVPLVVPEVNFGDIKNHKIIANPNCSTIQCMSILKLIDKLFGLLEVKFCTFQAVSGSGQKGLFDLEKNKHGERSCFYPHQINENVLPHIDKFLENGFTKEEMKMVNETQKILHLPTLKINATCVRVPVKFGHSVDIFLTTKTKVDIKKLKAEIKNFDGLVLLDNPQKNIYPMPIICAGTDSILVGRIRQDLFDENKLSLFVCADNIRKGAATNAVQILEKLIKCKKIT